MISFVSALRQPRFRRRGAVDEPLVHQQLTFNRNRHNQLALKARDVLEVKRVLDADEQPVQSALVRRRNRAGHFRARALADGSEDVLLGILRQLIGGVAHRAVHQVNARLCRVHVADEEVVVRAVVDAQHNVRAAEGFRFGEVRRRVVRADGNVRQVGDVNGVAPLADFALVIAGAERAEHQRLVEVLLQARRPNLGDEAGNSHMVLISFR